MVHKKVLNWVHSELEDCQISVTHDPAKVLVPMDQFMAGVDIRRNTERHPQIDDNDIDRRVNQNIVFGPHVDQEKISCQTVDQQNYRWKRT